MTDKLHVDNQLLYLGPRREKTCLLGFANNKGADRLISAYIIRLLQSIISKLATSEVSLF